jgi:hypothetical protein
MTSPPLEQPLYPLTVRWPSSESEVFQNENDVECNLEEFDSENVKNNAAVFDSLGRPVRLRVQALEIIKCTLK